MKWPLFAVVIVGAVCIILLSLISFGSVSGTPLPASNVPVESPVRLLIPSININASIQQVGINSKGEMEVPSNTAEVGWFKLGSPPGEKGSAVISGHFDGKDGKEGVFANLHKLKAGDKLHIEDGKGKLISFVVREKRTLAPGYADDVFNVDDGVAHLNLITCDGTWDGDKKSYSKRLVVFADISH